MQQVKCARERKSFDNIAATCSHQKYMYSTKMYAVNKNNFWKHLSCVSYPNTIAIENLA